MQKRRSLDVLSSLHKQFSSDPQSEIREMKKHVAQGQKEGDARYVGAAYYYTALGYYNLHDVNGVFINAVKAYTLLKDEDDYCLTADVMNALGYVYNQQENPQMSLSNNEEAYRFMKKHRIRGYRRVLLFNNLSISYHMFGNNDAAIRILNECMELLSTEMPDDYVNRAMFALNLGEYYKDAGHPEKTRETLTPMAEWIEKADFPALRCDYFLRCALNAFDLGDKEEGVRCADEALSRVPTDYFVRPVYEDLRHLMQVFCAEPDFDRMKRIFDLMTLFAENEKGTVEQATASQTFADYYRAIGQPERACEYYDKLSDLYDKRMKELREMQLTFHDRTKEAESEIRHLQRQMRRSKERQSKEPLTGLLNRVALLEVSSEFIKTAAKKKEKIGAIFLDIDCFKECNDTYGHARGDEVIKLVADACKEQEKGNIRFARYGGDEFFGITKGLTDEEVAAVAQRIFQSVRRADVPNEKNPNGRRITLSAGVVNVPVDGNTDTILGIANYADKAVYHAKGAGKNAIFFLDHKGENDAEYVQIEF